MQEYVNYVSRAVLERVMEQYGFKYLGHFTPIGNLTSILSQGLKRRDEMWRDSYTYTDEKRLDIAALKRGGEHREPINLSLNKINSRMLYYKTNMYSEFVILMLDPHIICDLECAFTKYNAAHHEYVGGQEKDGTRKIGTFENDLNSLKGEKAFIDLLSSRGAEGFDERITIFEDAEVLVFDNIPAKYISKVCFYDQRAWEKGKYDIKRRLGDRYLAEFEKKLFVEHSYFETFHK